MARTLQEVVFSASQPLVRGGIGHGRVRVTHRWSKGDSNPRSPRNIRRFRDRPLRILRVSMRAEKSNSLAGRDQRFESPLLQRRVRSERITCREKPLASSPGSAPLSH